MRNNALADKISGLINLDELVFDLTLSVAALVVYRLIVPRDGFLFMKTGVVEMIVIILCVLFFTALFFAGILRKYDELSEDCRLGIYPPAGNRIHAIDRLNKWMAETPFVGFLLGACIFVGINGLFILMPMDLYKAVTKIAVDAGREDANQFIVMFTLFLAGMSVILAGVTLLKGLQSLMKWFTITIIPFLAAVVMWITSIIYFAYLFGAVGVILFILISSGLVAGIVLLKVYFRDREITDIPVLEKVVPPVRMIVIPIFTALAMMAWNEMILISSANQLADNHISIDMANIFPYLLLGGLIPIRAVILFAPPVKPLNIVIAGAAFAWFFINLDSVIGTLSNLVISLR